MFYKVFYNHICIDYKSKSSRSQVFFKTYFKENFVEKFSRREK